jgi:[ribosomal protein S18]-alanine N-acetyltransferase
MPATVRHALAADVERIQQIAGESSSAAQWSEKQYERLFAEHSGLLIVLVLEKDHQVQGFIVARLAGDQWEIENIAVARALQRRGLASQLLCEFLVHARQSGKAVFLEVRESNLAARKLYEKMGFVQAGRRKGYYRSPAEDALILELSF